MAKKQISYLFFLTIAIVVILDQLSKFLITRVILAKYLVNPGSLWGLFPDATTLLIWFSVIVIGVFLYYYPKIIQQPTIVQVCSGLIVGGALGNLIDRILFGGVIDFINLGFWPSFNIADSALTVGIIVLIYYLGKKK